MSCCQYSPYEGTNNGGHRGPACTLVASAVPNKEPMSISYPEF